MLPTFIIGLREGLEASLIVGIIAAFLIQRGGPPPCDRCGTGSAWPSRSAWGWPLILEAVDRALPHKQQEGLETVLALVAVGGVTYMVVWMKRHSRELKGSLEQSAESALVTRIGHGRSSAWPSSPSCARGSRPRSSCSPCSATPPTRPPPERERRSGSRWPSAWGTRSTGAAFGSTSARFFRFTGFVLVLVAAGLLASAVHTAHEAGWIGVLQAQAFDLRWLVAPGSVRAALLTGMLGPPAGAHRRRDLRLAPVRRPDGAVRAVAGSAAPPDRTPRRTDHA